MWYIVSVKRHFACGPMVARFKMFVWKGPQIWNICHAEHAPFLASDMPKRKRYGHGLISVILI